MIMINELWILILVEHVILAVTWWGRSEALPGPA